MGVLWEFHFDAPSMWSWRKMAGGAVVEKSKWTYAQFDDAWNDAAAHGLRLEDRWVTRWFTRSYAG